MEFEPEITFHPPGKSIDHVITARQFLPQPIHRPLQHDPAADDRSHSRLPVRRRKRKTKDLSSAVIHQKSFMYNSCPQSESSFRRIFENMSGASFVENEFLLPHQIHLISGQESLRELMQQVMQKHNHFFSPRFSVQKICPVHIENKTDVSELVRKYTSHLDVCHLLRITLFTIFPFKLFGTKKQV